MRSTSRYTKEESDYLLLPATMNNPSGPGTCRFVTQCTAVRMKESLRIVPPQKNRLVLMLRKETTIDQLFGTASLPPTIREGGRITLL